MTLRDRILRSRASRRARHDADGDAVQALRESWSRYPREWKRDPGLNLGVRTLGEEWGGPQFADFVVELVSPYLGADVDVLELGCGGGKFSRRLAPRCRTLCCTDISPAMIEHTKQELARAGVGGNASYRVLNGVDFRGVENASVDFIFSYDVQLHLQPQNVFSYMLDARRVLREGGVFMLHQINLAKEGGMQHFLLQYSGSTWKRAFEDPRRRGHVYFMSADQMAILAAEARLQVERIVPDSELFHPVTAGRDLIGFFRKRLSRLELAGRDRIEPAERDRVELADRDGVELADRDVVEGDGVEPADRDEVELAGGDRVELAGRDKVALVKAEGGSDVYAVIEGRRLGFTSARQFERAGFRWEEVREVSPGALEAIPDGGPLEPWE